MMRPLRLVGIAVLGLAAVLGIVLTVGCDDAGTPVVDSSDDEAAARVTEAVDATEGTPHAKVEAPLPAGTFTHDQLIDDARQLLGILEENHPDPYTHGGGRVAFHIRFQQMLAEIPEEGMTKEAFAKLLIPFVASVGDGHTDVWAAYTLDPDLPGGVPLRFEVVEQSLYVSAVVRAQDMDLIGATLVSVEGVPFDELRARQRELRGIENEYHDLLWLLSTLWYRAYLQDLIPDWTDTSSIQTTLRLPDGTLVEESFPAPLYSRELRRPLSRARAIDPGPYGFNYVVSEDGVATLRVDDMTKYREVLGRTGDLSLADTPENRAAVPSATETFRQLVIDMREAGTETLIVDLRNDPGGASIMSQFLVYFLYGRDVLFDVTTDAVRRGGGQIERIGPLEMKYYKDTDLAELSLQQGFLIQTGDYKTVDHYDYYAEYAEGLGLTLEELGEQMKDEVLDRMFEDYPEFDDEVSAGTYAGYHTPENVIVLVRPRTYSSGYTLMADLSRAGATLIGTPSAQSGNTFGEGQIWTLDHTGIRGLVSHNVYIDTADDPERGRVWPVDVQMTYADLVDHEFDPNTETLLAMEWLRAKRESEQEADREAAARLESKLPDVREALRIPGLAAAVVRDGELIWSGGFGLADLESGVEVTADTPFGLASVTKPFAAFLLMRKVEEGLLDLDTPVREFGIEFEDETITVRHLLSHTSGGVPGTAYRYSGDRYSRLTPVIEQLYGATFREVLRQEILEPLGMDDTALNYGGCGLSYYLSTLAEDDPERAFEHVYRDAATPYLYDDAYEPYPTGVPSYANAAAGLISTASDLARFASAIEADVLVSAETKETMFTPTRLNSGERGPYGLGWFTEEYEGTEIIWHYGYGAYSTIFVMIPSEGLTFIALANSQNLSRPFGLGSGDVSVLSSPAALAFYKAFVVQPWHEEPLPEIDWSSDPGDVVAELASITDAELVRLYERELWTYRKLYAGVGRKDISADLFEVHRAAFPAFTYSMSDRYEVGRPGMRSAPAETFTLSDEQVQRWLGRFALDPDDAASGLPLRIAMFEDDGRLLAVPEGETCQLFVPLDPNRLASTENPAIQLVAEALTGPIRRAVVELDGQPVGTYERVD